VKPQEQSESKPSPTTGFFALLCAFLLPVLLLVPFLTSQALAAGDLNESTCPTETETSPGFRAFMPDCRAYELVTPPYIGGQVPYGKSNIASRQPEIARNGEHLLGIVFAGFAETENLEQSSLEYGATYEFSRASAGWTAEALDPPASEYPRRNFDFPSADLSRSLWEVYTTPHDGEELAFPYINNAMLAIREPAGGGKGRFTVVGPVVAPEHEPARPSYEPFEAVGASADLTHVLLLVKAELKGLWPGDETLPGDKSLYEYRGTDEREPILVGVKNEGALEGVSHINEHAELVSRCGTVLGGVEISTGYNAVSASGEVVYFTALECAGEPPVNELYARLAGKRTVDISEPTTGPEGDCEDCRESEPKAAVFEGASEDGSKVFFLSEQELLPGAKGDSLYEYDFHPTDEHHRVTLLAPEVTSVTAPSEEGARVYFQSTAKLPTGPNRNGEGPETVVENPAADNLYLYNTETERTAYVAQTPEPVDASRDGQFAVFESATALRGTEDTSAPVNQLFEYDADTGTVARVSIGQASPEGYECPATHVVEEGYDCDGNTTNGEDAPTMGTPASYSGSYPAEASSKLSVSANGAVAFVSRDALTPSAVAGGENIYEYRAGEVYLISAGDEAQSVYGYNGEVRLEGIDESGGDVFFRSTDSLVPQDTDSQASFYDARVGGGFPAPARQPACIGEACQGPMSAPPALPATPGSALTHGGGNIAPSLDSTVKRRPVTRAEELQTALKACRKKKRREPRATCERQARKRYGATKQKGER